MCQFDYVLAPAPVNGSGASGGGRGPIQDRYRSVRLDNIEMAENINNFKSRNLKSVTKEGTEIHRATAWIDTL